MDRVLKALSHNQHIRIQLADIKDTTAQAQKLHDLYPTSLAALGRVMAINAIMASDLKEKGESIQTTIDGNGPIGKIIVKADSEGNIKGYVGDPHLMLTYPESSKLAVGIAVGKDGYLSVGKDLKLKERFTSHVALQSGEIGDDFAYYFAMSEQIPSLVAVGVLVDKDHSCISSGAMLISLMPGHTEEDIQELEELEKHLKPISQSLKEASLETILKTYFPGNIIIDEKAVRYHCDCHKERFKKALLTLPLKDLKELSAADQKIQCEFCGKEYIFTKAEITELIKDVSNR